MVSPSTFQPLGPVPAAEHRHTSLGIPTSLRSEVANFVDFLSDPRRNDADQYPVVQARFDAMKFATQEIERSGEFEHEQLNLMRDWFRSETDPVILRGRMLNRVRRWPEGYPGDYKTLESFYANEPAGDGLPRHLDTYTLGRTLAVAVRSRIRKLGQYVHEQAERETTAGNWLNLACGSSRELLTVRTGCPDTVVHLLDTDANALSFSEQMLANKLPFKLQLHHENALRFVEADRNIRRFGRFTMIYSAGLFDYIPTDKLVRLLAGLYGSLADGGLFVTPFKDRRRYETFDYHWVAKWNYFFQREEAEFRSILADAGIPDDAIRAERDESGVIIFYSITKR
jgi:hypothetical protein